MRLFVGISLPMAVRSELALPVNAALARVPARLQKVALWDWHLTLVFLGLVPPAGFDDLSAALARADLGRAMSLTSSGFGVFPEAACAKIAWLGVGGALAGLSDLQQRVAAVCTAQGHALEKRPYVPHITLARSNRTFSARAFLDAPPPAQVSFTVDRITIYESVAAEAMRYQPRAEISLREA